MNPHLQRALILIDQSRYELAEQELRQVLSQNPDDGFAHSVLAICLSECEKPSEAIQEIELALGLAPEEAYVFYAKSIVLSESNHFREAQVAIEEAIGIDPYQPDYFARLSQLHFYQRRWKEAKAAADQGLELDPEDVSCTNLRAMALVKLGKNIEAKGSLDTALKRAPEDAISHANMGWSLIEQSQPEPAMEHFREALRLNPSLEWARQGIVEAMKAHYFIYRLMLNWFLWMGKLSGKAQWGVIVGAYFGFQVLRRVAAQNPDLAPWIRPLLIVYVVFAAMTWVSVPLFNFLLRLNRFGRLALSKEQIRTSNWVGLCIVGAIGFIIAYFATGVNEMLACALSCGLMIPLLAHIYDCERGWPRATIILITIGLFGLTAITISATIASLYQPTGELKVALRGLGLTAFLVFVVAAVISQFGVGALVSARPHSSNARGVWIVGSLVLAVCASLAVLVGLSVVSVFYDDHYGKFIDMPIRTKLVKKEDSSWLDEIKITNVAEELKQLGFIWIGDFSYEGFNRTNARYLLNPEKSIVAEVLESPTSGSTVSLTTVYNDGLLVTYFSGSAPEFESPPEISKFRLPDRSPTYLYRQLCSERPQELIRKVIAAEVPLIAEQTYAKEIDYQLARGGPSSAEIKAIAEEKDDSVSDAVIAQLQRRWRRQAAVRVDEFVLNQFLKANPEYLEKRDRLFCIHDLLGPQVLASYCIRNERAGDGTMTQLIEMAETGTPRNIFPQMAASYPDLKKIDAHLEPIATDIYLIKQ